MTSDDQQFLDLLASVPQDIAHYGSRIAEYIEKHTNAIASDIRDAIDSATWIPDSIRPPRQASHRFYAQIPPPPQGWYEKTTSWISRNRNTIAVVVAFAGTTIFLIHRKRKAHARKRRAKKFPNGGKREIVVLACSTFSDPLTRSLAVDLERRGYIVYITVSSSEEESLVQAESRPDLRPLWMDLSSTVPNPSVDVHPDLEPILERISRSPGPSSPPATKSPPTTSSQNYILAGVVALPGSTGYPNQPLALLTPSEVIDTVNTRLIAPILTVQKFLPLLASHSLDPKFPSAVVLAYPSISMYLSPPNSVPEVVTSSSMSALAAVLRREVKTINANITISEIRLGNFDLGSTHIRPPRELENQGQASALTHWHSSQRAAAQRSSFGQSSTIKGSSAREFHNAVFDALAPPQMFKAFGKFEWQFSRRSSVVFVGSGAGMYAVLGKCLPAGLVSWMMGYERSTSLSKPPERHPSTVPTENPMASSNVWGTSSTTNESQMWEKV